MSPLERYTAVSIQLNENTAEIVTYSEFVKKLAKPMGTRTLDLLHGAVGISGEAGELLDAVKKTWVYNKPLDHINVLEELGDLRFYMQVVMNQLGMTDQMVVQHNADKLCERYKGLTYSDQAAQARADKEGDTK